jgi:hypothetical protein
MAGRFQDIAGNSHQCRSIAGRHCRLGLAVLDLLDRHAHGRVLLPAQGNFEWIVHRDHFTGHSQMGARMGKTGKLVWQAHQNQGSIRVLLQKMPAGRQRDLGTVVASHAVNSDCDHGVGTQKEDGIKQWPEAKNNKSPTLQDL